MITVFVLQSDTDEKDVVDESEKNPTSRHALVVGSSLIVSQPPPRVTLRTLFLLWQFLTSAHDDVVLLYDIANIRPTGESNGHKDFSSAERNI
jgi:hypothetical protein